MFRESHLTADADALRSGARDLLDYIDQACDRIDTYDGQIEAFVPEPGRRDRLRREARTLVERIANPAIRPPLFGVLIGVKDIYRVDGFPTRAGSQVPPEVLAGAQASVVTKLRAAGALILGKTVTAEFAYVEPGPTRNPHHLAHTPGGSSSGSAAAVAVGYCPLALGTQTIGSVIRPAAYCGVVGFKPSIGRIPTDGVIAVSTALDHIGLFAQDLDGIELVASLLCRDWRGAMAQIAHLPTLGIPDDAYLEQASPEALEVFADQLMALEKAGYVVKRTAALSDIQMLSEHTFRMMSVEMAEAHTDWFPQFGSLYRPRTAEMIRDGQAVTPEQHQSRSGRFSAAAREALTTIMQAESIDLWISPAATGAAPLGLDSTGDPAMNLPWTLTGVPTITVPVPQRSAEGLPFGLQIAGAMWDDARLIQWSKGLAKALASSRE